MSRLKLDFSLKMKASYHPQNISELGKTEQERYGTYIFQKITAKHHYKKRKDLNKDGFPSFWFWGFFFGFGLFSFLFFFLIRGLKNRKETSLPLLVEI